MLSMVALVVVLVATAASALRLTEAIRKAEAELDAATSRSAVNAAARKVMRAKEALKAAREERSIPAGARARAS